MSLWSVVAVSLVLYVSVCSSHSLQVGTTVNAQLAFVEDVKLSSFPLKTRTKNVFYTGEKMIKGLSAVDRANSKANATITAGGVGALFANIRLKSKSGDGLNYQIQIFV